MSSNCIFFLWFASFFETSFRQLTKYLLASGLNKWLPSHTKHQLKSTDLANPLSAWTHARGLETPSECWVCPCLYPWNCSQMCRWCLLSCLPLDIHIFSWLSWKVHFDSLHYRALTDDCILCRVLLTNIRDNGTCLCLRCLVPKKKADQMSLIYDLKLCVCLARTYLFDEITRACDFIFNKGYMVGSAAVERLCKPQSIVLTMVSLSSHWYINPTIVDSIIVECLCEKTRINVQSLSDADGRSNAWVWARCIQGHSHSYHPCPLCSW